MKNPGLPRVEEPLVDGRGVLTGEWARRFADLFAWVNQVWKADKLPTSNAPSFAIQTFAYAQMGGFCHVTYGFSFNGATAPVEITVSLPVPAVSNFGQFPGFAIGSGGYPVPINCWIGPDGLVHITLPNAVPFAAATISIQFSGAYRAQ